MSPATPFIGQILDADGHMYMNVETLREVAGDLSGGHMLDYIGQYVAGPKFAADRNKNRSELWNVKGIAALGAYDPVERIEALDAMGMRAQFAFYNTGSGEGRIASAAARAASRRYNDYGLDWQRKTGGRVLVAMQINMSDVTWAIEETKRVIKAGAKVVTLPSAQAPAGVSPAHEIWDPFWALLEEANVPATLHLGTGGLMANKKPDALAADGDVMLPDRAWGNAASLKGAPADRPGGEEAISPYFMLVAHTSAEIYLTTMIMGSVFERFPRLRFGIIELGASWIGPAVERMDLWAEFMGKVGRKYKLKPSEYVSRNVRVTPFWNENLPKMIERYGMEDAYIFSTDYPHLEGSRDPLGKFSKWLKQLPTNYAQKFFVDNARLLFPDP
jgi:predicted TIM-barrel fold metal-dependent hydrolase